MQRNLMVALLFASACRAVDGDARSPEAAASRQPLANPVQLQLPRYRGTQANERFGHAVATGNFDGDSATYEVAIGAPGWVTDGGHLNVGRVTVWSSPAPGLLPTLLASLLPTNVAQAGAGSALAVGDYDDDGYDDLAIGAPAAPLDAGTAIGAVYIYHGNPFGFAAPVVCRNSIAGSDFGRALLTDDTAVPNQLWVGAPSVSKVYLFKEAAGACVPTGVFVQGAGNDQFGSSLAAGDLDGDAEADLIVGAPLANANAGAVHYFTRTSGAPSFSSAEMGSQTEQLGRAVAFIDSDTVVRGAPGHVLGGRLLVGAESAAPQIDAYGGAVAAELGFSLISFARAPTGTAAFAAGAPGGDNVQLYTADPILMAYDAYALAVAPGSRFGCALSGTHDLKAGDPAPDLLIGAESYSEGGGAQTGAVFLVAGRQPSMNADAGVPSADGGMGVSDAGTVVVVADFSLSALDERTVTATPSARGPVDDWVWDFGDLSPPVATKSSTPVSHTYAVPGGYQVQLSVSGTIARMRAAAKRQVLVPDRLGRTPPTALIVATPVGVDATHALMKLVCRTDAEGATVRWQFSDGSAEEVGNDVMHDFPRGAWRVHCWVESSNGLWAHDSEMFDVWGTAQECRVAFDPPAGPAPLPVTHTMYGPNGSLSQTTRLDLEGRPDVPNGSPASYDPGWHRASVTVTSQVGSNVQCADHGRIFVYTPRTFSSTLPPRVCGTRYETVIAPEGEGPVRLAAKASVTDMTFDETTGLLAWPAQKASRQATVQLTATDAYDTVTADYDVSVTCPPPNPVPDSIDFGTRACDCSTGSALPVMAAALALALRRRRR